MDAEQGVVLDSLRVDFNPATIVAINPWHIKEAMVSFCNNWDWYKTNIEKRKCNLIDVQFGFR